MTIKEFAQLCGCNAQTLRYYDKIDLLKPVRVDQWTQYRHYDPVQAVDFVKIKNLQAADFSIGEIKELLRQPEERVYAAFAEKIREQTQKLERIREIQRSYLAEKITMENIIHSMTDYILSQCRHPEVLWEFGLQQEEAPEVLELLRRYMNGHIIEDTAAEDVTMTINDEVVQGRNAVLNRIQGLTEENLTDTIFLDTGMGHSMEHNSEPEPDFSGYDCLWERRGWNQVRDFLPDLPKLQPGVHYCLWLRTHEASLPSDLSFPLYLMGAVLRRQKDEELTVNCAISTVEGHENHFKLLRKKDS